MVILQTKELERWPFAIKVGPRSLHESQEQLESLIDKIQSPRLKAPRFWKLYATPEGVP